MLPDEHRAPEGFDELLSRVQTLRESIATVSDEAIYSEEMPESEPEDTVPEDTADGQLYADIDPELLEIFLEESEENLETSDAALVHWRADHTDREALAELQRALHTVKGGARMAELGAVGDLAHAVESLIITISDCGGVAGDEALEGVQRAQDALVGMLDEVRNGKPMSEQNTLIEELQALRTNVLSDLPAEESIDNSEIPDEIDSHETAPEEVHEVHQESVGETTVNEGLYSEIDPELLEVFLEEAADILEHSEETLRNWKDDANNRELMAEFQRCIP